jgi:hypothetical protein
MGDILRQLFYPLVLPGIVAAVWLHAWSLKLEPGYYPPVRLPAGIRGPNEGPVVSVPGPPFGTGYGFATDDDSRASLDEE